MSLLWLRARLQRLDQYRTDANHLQEWAAALRTKPSQAKYTNRELDHYPRYGLAALFDTIGREISTGQTRFAQPDPLLSIRLICG